jgi:hypothetical protein
MAQSMIIILLSKVVEYIPVYISCWNIPHLEERTVMEARFNIKKVMEIWIE